LRAGLHVHGREHEVWYVLEGKFRFRLGDALGAYRTSIDKMLPMRRLSL
jgi:mannose-6-phosphate isomerase-like protein (cupin superfamily)